MLTDDTIAAISTPVGEGALAVIRVSGPDTRAILSKIVPHNDLFANPRRLIHTTVRHGSEPVDSVLAVGFTCPSSYTGEDAAEIHCHGGTFVSSRVLEVVLEAGARMAEPGEFTRRAFINGKMDLTQAEAVMDIIRARTAPALRAAGDQLDGHLGREFALLRGELLTLVANIEAWIDFPEEDIDPQTGEGFIARAAAVSNRIEHFLATAEEGRILREGVKLVLCGAPNAGKSSLLNRLLGCERAIVTPTPGTTRDTIEEPANLGGILFRITDTAGLRETLDPIEQIGVARARDAMAAADIILRVIDASEVSGPPAHRDPRELRVYNKSDLVPGFTAPGGEPLISCTTGVGFDTLLSVLHDRVGPSTTGPSAAAINARHQACLVRAREGVYEALSELRSGHAPEYAAPGLHSALDAIGEVLGAADTEEILGAIFSSFCIGK